MCPGGAEEQAAAATVFTLLCIQLGGGDEAEEGFKVLRPIFTSILNDSSASITARQSVSSRVTTSVFERTHDFEAKNRDQNTRLCLSDS